MTNEEAIKVLNMIEAHGSLTIQAKEKAIKALEQEIKSAYICSICKNKDCPYSDVNFRIGEIKHAKL